MMKYSKSPDVMIITKICLTTGARWEEIQNRKDHHFKHNQIYLMFTKSKKNRVTPLYKRLFREVKAHIEEYGELTNCQESFRRALISLRLYRRSFN